MIFEVRIMDYGLMTTTFHFIRRLLLFLYINHIDIICVSATSQGM